MKLELKQVVDPLIYPHVKLLNDMGVKTEFSCAGIGERHLYNGKIQRCHSYYELPHVILKSKINNECKNILGLIMFYSPEIYYCKKERKLLPDRVYGKCKCGRSYNLINTGMDIDEIHQYFKLINIYSTTYERKMITCDRNLESLMCQQKHLFLPLKRMFLSKLLTILKKINKEKNEKITKVSERPIDGRVPHMTISHEMYQRGLAKLREQAKKEHRKLLTKMV